MRKRRLTRRVRRRIKAARNRSRRRRHIRGYTVSRGGIRL